jgi:AraC family transcriptional regulator
MSNNQQHQRRGLPGMRRAEIGRCCAELLPRSPYEAAYTPESSIIGFAFEGQTGVHAFGTDRRTCYRAKPNALAHVPQGCDVYSRSHDGGEYLKLAVRLEHEDTRLCGRRFSDVVDVAAIRAAQSLREILLRGGPLDPVSFEYWLDRLIDRAAYVMGRNESKPRAGSWMTARRLKRVDDLIDARLDGRLTVQELATAVGLSTGFFSRAFKAAVGKAPHDYIIDRRISRARTLLQMDELGLSDVALASGFTSHAHMTATFRSRLGVTPSQLRR